MVDLTNEDDIIDALRPARGRSATWSPPPPAAASCAESEDLLAEKRTGKQVLNVRARRGGGVCVAGGWRPRGGHRRNRKLLVFPLEQLPEMARGSGVILQKYKDGGLADVKTFTLAEGLTWRLGDKTRTEHDLRPWLGERAQAGRLPPNGFPKSGRFA